MKRIERLIVSPGNFFRCKYMEYTFIEIEKDIMISSGDSIIIECAESKVFDKDEEVLVREIVDFDAMAVSHDDSDTYIAVIRNPNYHKK